MEEEAKKELIELLELRKKYFIYMLPDKSFCAVETLLQSLENKDKEIKVLK